MVKPIASQIYDLLDKKIKPVAGDSINLDMKNQIDNEQLKALLEWLIIDTSNPQQNEFIKKKNEFISKIKKIIFSNSSIDDHGVDLIINFLARHRPNLQLSSIDFVFAEKNNISEKKLKQLEQLKDANVWSSSIYLAQCPTYQRLYNALVKKPLIKRNSFGWLTITNWIISPIVKRIGNKISIEKITNVSSHGASINANGSWGNIQLIVAEENMQPIFTNIYQSKSDSASTRAQQSKAITIHVPGMYSNASHMAAVAEAEAKYYLEQHSKYVDQLALSRYGSNTPIEQLQIIRAAIFGAIQHEYKEIKVSGFSMGGEITINAVTSVMSDPEIRKLLKEQGIKLTYESGNSFEKFSTSAGWMLLKKMGYNPVNSQKYLVSRFISGAVLRVANFFMDDTQLDNEFNLNNPVSTKFVNDYESTDNFAVNVYLKEKGFDPEIYQLTGDNPNHTVINIRVTLEEINALVKKYIEAFEDEFHKKSNLQPKNINGSVLSKEDKEKVEKELEAARDRLIKEFETQIQEDQKIPGENGKTLFAFSSEDNLQKLIADHGLPAGFSPTILRNALVGFLFFYKAYENCENKIAIKKINTSYLHCLSQLFPELHVKRLAAIEEKKQELRAKTPAKLEEENTQLANENEAAKTYQDQIKKPEEEPQKIKKADITQTVVENLKESKGDKLNFPEICKAKCSGYNNFAKSTGTLTNNEEYKFNIKIYEYGGKRLYFIKFKDFPAKANNDAILKQIVEKAVGHANAAIQQPNKFTLLDPDKGKETLVALKNAESKNENIKSEEYTSLDNSKLAPQFDDNEVKKYQTTLHLNDFSFFSGGANEVMNEKSEEKKSEALLTKETIVPS